MSVNVQLQAKIVDAEVLRQHLMDFVATMIDAIQTGLSHLAAYPRSFAQLGSSDQTIRKPSEVIQESRMHER